MLVGFAVSGCSDGNVARLSGTVTLDGALVEKGTISLAPADGRAPTAEALINGGKYSVTTLPGPKKIVIHGLKQVGTRRDHPEDPSSPMVDVHEETVRRVTIPRANSASRSRRAGKRSTSP